MESTKPVQNENDLRILIESAGLTKSAAQINRKARTCIYLIAGELIGEVPLGCTRLGGLPDLPEGTQWPCDEAKVPHIFFGQFDLKEIYSKVGATELPKSGLLSLFAGGSFGARDEPDVQVLYSPVNTLLGSVKMPEGHRGRLLNSISISFETGLMLPTDNFDFLSCLEEKNPECDIDLLIDGMSETPVGTIGQLLGYAVTHQAYDHQEAVVFRKMGYPNKEDLMQWSDWDSWEEAKRKEMTLANGSIYRPWSSDDDDVVRWIHNNRADIEEQTERLRMLFGVESNKLMNLWINDADPIHFLIDGHALQNCDFAGTMAITSQS